MVLPKWLGKKLVEGFFILLPVLIAYLMLGQLFDGLLATTQPVVDVLPAKLFESEHAHRLVAATALLVIFVLIGIVSTTRPAWAFGGWIERNVLNRFPQDTIVRTLASRIGGENVSSQLQPAPLTVSPGIRMLVAIVEELPDDELTVFLPLAPTPGMGWLQIVSASKVEPLESSMSDSLGWALNWGMGTEALLGGQRVSGRQE